MKKPFASRQTKCTATHSFSFQLRKWLRLSLLDVLFLLNRLNSYNEPKIRLNLSLSHTHTHIHVARIKKWALNVIASKRNWMDNKDEKGTKSVTESKYIDPMLLLDIIKSFTLYSQALVSAPPWGKIWGGSFSFSCILFLLISPYTQINGSYFAGAIWNYRALRIYQQKAGR